MIYPFAHTIAKGVALAAAIQAASSQTVMYMNYYIDQSCKQFSAQLPIDKSVLDTCVNYNLPGVGSFNVANCLIGKQYSGCQCTWYTEPNCAGFTATGGVLSNGGALNSMLTSNPTGYNVENCGQTEITFQEAQSFICVAGFWIN